jgi:hypothetical protein
MADQPTVVACPLCGGQGEVSPEALESLFSNPELRKRFDARIEEIVDIYNSVGAASKPKVLDFQKEVHSWNPTLPIWRRSSKE